MLDRLKQELATANHALIEPIVDRLVAMALRDQDSRFIDEAEAQLKSAAVAGNQKAASYLLAEWPKEKQSALHVLRSRSA